MRARRLPGWAHSRPRWQQLGVAAGLAIAVAVVLASMTPQGRTAARAAMFVPQVLPAVPVKPQQWFTPAPIVERVSFPNAEGEGVADVYRPAGDGPHPATLLFLGVAPAAAEDPRVINLGEALARSGTVAAFYWSPLKLEKRINPRDIENLVYAFRFLQDQPHVDPERVGMGGFCVGASFALMAASQEDIRDSVLYVNAFGPYFSARDFMASVSSETRFHDGETQPWTVDQLTREVFQLELIRGVADEAERQALSNAFEPGGSAGTIDEESLSDHARTVFRLLRGAPLDEAHQLVAQLPEAELARIDLISPSSHLDSIKARVLVMHDREDHLVPSDESRRLVETLQAQDSPVYYTEFSFFQHVDPTRSVSPPVFVREAGKLFMHMYNVLRVSS